MRYDAVMGLGFSTMKLIIHESFFWLKHREPPGNTKRICECSGGHLSAQTAQMMRPGQGSPGWIIFPGFILSGMYRASELGRMLGWSVFGVEWGGDEKTYNFSLPASMKMSGWAQSLPVVHWRGAGLGVRGIGVFPGFLRVDGGKSLRCVHHQHILHGSSWRSLTSPCANVL